MIIILRINKCTELFCNILKEKKRKIFFLNESASTSRFVLFLIISLTKKKGKKEKECNNT